MCANRSGCAVTVYYTPTVSDSNNYFARDENRADTQLWVNALSCGCQHFAVDSRAAMGVSFAERDRPRSRTPGTLPGFSLSLRGYQGSSSMGIPRTYFVASHNAVKIGKSSRPNARIKTLQTAHPIALRTLLVLEGDREQEFHIRFARHRKMGEWFVLSDEILDFIDEHTGGKKPFRRWLLDQRFRPYGSEVGSLGLKVAKDPKIPCSNLGVLLNHYADSPRWRRAAKRAHSEWNKENRKNGRATSGHAPGPEGPHA
jgi:hypothetical protein